MPLPRQRLIGRLKSLIIQQRSLFVTAVPMTCLMLALGAMSWLQVRTARTEQSVQQTQTVQQRTYALLAMLLNAETGVRGYDLASDEAFLEPYNDAKQNIAEMISGLEDLVSDNPEQQARLGTINDTVAALLGLLEQSVTSVETVPPGVDEALGNRDSEDLTPGDLDLNELNELDLENLGGLGENSAAFSHLRETKALMDEARIAIAAFRREEERLLGLRLSRLAEQRRTTWRALAVIAGLGMVGTVLTAISFRRLDQDLEAKNRFFDLSMDLLVITGNDGQFYLTNPAIYHTLGYTQADISNHNWLDWVHPEDQAKTRAFYEQLINHQNLQFENRCRHKDGSYRWISWTAVTQADEDRVYSVGRDITDRKASDAALFQEQEFTRVMIESFSEGVVACDADGRLTRFNRVARAWHGVDPRDVPQAQWSEFYDLYEGDGVTPLATAAIPLVRAYNGETVQDVEMSIVAVDQSVRYLLASAAPLIDGQGGKIGAVSVMHDVTERRQFEQALERERQQLRQIVSCAPVAMAMFDTEMRYIAHSDQWRSAQGLPAEEPLLGRSNYDVAPNTPEHWRTIFERALKGETLSSPEAAVPQPDGSVIYLRWAVRPWYRTPDGTGGGDIGGLVMATDRIDELVKAREAAKDSARTKAQFLANMSHEIRTPMNGVLGMARLMLKTQLTPKQRDFAEAISTSADHLLSIINDILDFSKLEAQEMQLECLAFTLNDCIETVVNLVSSQAAEKNLELAFLVDHAAPQQLWGDPGRLRQVLVNLLGNAVKFTETGEVVVRVTPIGESPHGAGTVQLRFEVSDTGIGISPEGQTRLFQAFSQVDGSTTRQYEGTGLGLVICRELVALMGGEIGVNSVQGQGTTFWFTAQFEQRTSPPRPTLKLPPLKLLIADDSATARQSVRHLTEVWGMTSREAADGLTLATELRNAAQNGQPFEAAIIDQGLPGLALKTLRQASPETRLIVMAPINQRDQAESLIALGADSYLLKPVRPSQLFDCLLSAVAQQISQTLAVSEVQGNATAGSSRPRHSTRILLVEDHPINQMVILNQLDDLGYRADVAHNGKEALEQLQQQSYDIVLMDCQMPELDGYETTQRLRQRPEAVQPVVVALTAHAMPEDREKCLAMGMDDYISKPVDQDQLAQVLARWQPCEPNPGSRPEPRTAQRSTPRQGLGLSPVGTNPKGQSVNRTMTATLKPADDQGQIQRQVLEATTSTEVIAVTNSAAGLSAAGGPINLTRLQKVSRGNTDFEQRLLEQFLLKAKGDIEELRLASGNAEQLGLVAHRLKGASSNVGLDEVTAIASALEKQANGDTLEPARILADIEAMNQQLVALEQFMVRYFPSA